MSDGDLACLISIVCLVIFWGAGGFLLGCWFAKRFYKHKIETAEEKLRLAEYTWEMIGERAKDESRVKRMETFRKYKEWEFYRARIPNGVPPDYNP